MHKKYKKLKRYARFKRFIVSTWLYVKLKRLSTKPFVISEREEAIIEIVTQHLLDKKSQMAIAPVTGNRYIVSSDDSLHIILTPINIILSNHSYYYDIRLGSDAVRLIYNKFDRIMESRCRRVESEIHGNMMSSLYKIADKAVTFGQAIVPNR